MTIIHTPNPLQVQKYRMPEPIHQDKTQAKVIAYWLGIFLIAAAIGVLSPVSCIAVSTIFICAEALYRRVQTTHAYKSIFKRQSKDSLKEQVMAESKQLRVRIADLEARIKMIDQFVLERPDLRRVVEEHIEKYGEYIANGSTGVNIVANGPDDWIGQYGVLSLKITRLEHWLNERKRFIESHTAVRQCFEKHILALRRT